MSDRVSVKGCSIVSCGTMRMEVEALRRSGFLDADEVLYCAPGLHEWPRELEQQLQRQLAAAGDASPRTIVIYGEKCFIDVNDPRRVTDALVRQYGANAVRVDASNCVDMLASRQERRELAAAHKVYWLTPGWLKHWDFIFKNWDSGKANEMFPAYDKAVVLDALSYFEQLMEESPERILEISDWMKIPVESVPVSLGRLKSLIAAAGTAAAD